MTQLHQHRLTNGLILVAEQIPQAQSLALTLLLPAGVVQEADDRQGSAAVLAEMLCRGAGELDARAHSDALEQLGVQRDTAVETRHLAVAAVMVHDKLPAALPLLLDMALRPRLTEETFLPSRDLALQALASLEDDPQSKVFVELRRRHFAPPFNRSTMGLAGQLETLTLADVRALARRVLVPGGAILALAGKFSWEALVAQVERLTATWRGGCAQPDALALTESLTTHLSTDSAQVHIGLALDAVPETHPQSMLQRAAVAVLAGGTSSRLFTEVREKRGLCYTVGARYAGDHQRGIVLGYAGTTAPRAQETLDVMLDQWRRLAEGVASDEFARTVVGMKSGLVMQGESTSARAQAIAQDQFLFGQPRSLDDWTRKVDALTLADLNDFVRTHPPGRMTLVTIGPSPLQV